MWWLLAIAAAVVVLAVIAVRSYGWRPRETKTVSVHIQNAMKKLEVPTRTQAVARAHQLGLVNGHGANGNGNRNHDEVRAHIAERPARPRRHREPQRPAA